MTKFLIDFDSTLNQFDQHQVNSVNEKFGTNYSVDQMTHWHWWHDETAEDHAAFAWCDEVFHSRQWTLDCPIQPGAANAMRLLYSMGNELHIVSDRAPHMQEWIETWLELHGLTVTQVVVSDRAHRPKWLVVNEFGLDVVVEDAEHNVRDIARGGVAMQIYLLNKPWNSSYEEPHNVTRLDTWNQVLQAYLSYVA